VPCYAGRLAVEKLVLKTPKSTAENRNGENLRERHRILQMDIYPVDSELTKLRTRRDFVRFDGDFATSRTRVRRGWDSNPRGTFIPAGFQDRCLQPLGHPSPI
jgi:hypothetical protein